MSMATILLKADQVVQIKNNSVGKLIAQDGNELFPGSAVIFCFRNDFIEEMTAII